MSDLMVYVGRDEAGIIRALSLDSQDINSQEALIELRDGGLAIERVSAEEVSWAHLGTAHRYAAPDLFLSHKGGEVAHD